MTYIDPEALRRDHADEMIGAIRDVLANIAEDAESLDADRMYRAVGDKMLTEDPRGAMLAAADLLDLAGADWPVVGRDKRFSDTLHNMAATLRARCSAKYRMVP